MSSSTPDPATGRRAKSAGGRRLGTAGRLRAYFLAGVLITAPVSITLYLAWVVINLIDTRVGALIPAKFHPETYLPFALPGLGVVVLAVGLILIGALTAGYVGRLITGMFEALLTRTPIVRSLYGAVKQIVETLLAQQSSAFREAVLVEYPRRGIWAIGFLTGVTRGEVQRLTDDEVINVFVPTTPNPTSGFLLFVPRQDLVPLTMSVEDALKLVVSGGIVTPRDPIEQLAGGPAVEQPLPERSPAPSASAADRPGG